MCSEDLTNYDNYQPTKHDKLFHTASSVANVGSSHIPDRCLKWGGHFLLPPFLSSAYFFEAMAGNDRSKNPVSLLAAECDQHNTHHTNTLHLEAQVQKSNKDTNVIVW